MRQMLHRTDIAQRSGREGLSKEEMKIRNTKKRKQQKIQNNRKQTIRR
jgi:hypothetical protein